jgi:hypothetical protein
MSTGWILFTAIVTLIILRAILMKPRKPVVLEGRVVEKNVAKNSDDDLYVTIETPVEKRVLLKFETHSVGVLIQIGGESFHDRAEELDSAIALNDVVSVESYDEDGLTRDVYKLLSVSKTS